MHISVRGCQFRNQKRRTNYDAETDRCAEYQPDENDVTPLATAMDLLFL